MRSVVILSGVTALVSADRFLVCAVTESKNLSLLLLRTEKVNACHYFKRVLPMRNLSTPAAALRPSEIAHTTSDCPRRMSPAAKIPGTELM